MFILSTLYNTKFVLHLMTKMINFGCADNMVQDFNHECGFKVPTLVLSFKYTRSNEQCLQLLLELIFSPLSLMLCFVFCFVFVYRS